jgi:hypothetical protein
MYNKTTYLFDKNKHVKLPLPEQESFEKENKPFLNRIYYLINMAFEEMTKRRNGRSKMETNKNWPANELSCILWDLIAKEFPTIVRDTKRGGYCLNLNDKCICYIKKLYKKHFQPEYHHSDKSRQICDQIGDINEKPLPIVFIGYTANKKLRVITGYYAVCVKENKVIWCTDLTALLPAYQERATYDTSPTPEVTVQVKVKRKAN